MKVRNTGWWLKNWVWTLLIIQNVHLKLLFIANSSDNLGFNNYLN